MRTRPIAASQASVCASAGESVPVAVDLAAAGSEVEAGTSGEGVDVDGDVEGDPRWLLTAGQADERRGTALTDRAGRFGPVD